MERIASYSLHDAVFKHLLSQRATARDFLHIHLPKHLQEQCDLRTLQLESGSFIDEDFKPHKETLMHIAHFLEERGRKEGILQGMKVGIEKGLQKGSRKGCQQYVFSVSPRVKACTPYRLTTFYVTYSAPGRKTLTGTIFRK